MPSFERDSNRIVIAGASSLLGTELKSLLEESRFAAWDLRLVDEEVAAGTLTEAGGEPAVIQPVEEGGFDCARYVFFTGSLEFTLANFELAHRSGAMIIDLSGHSAAFANSFAWFPGLEKLRGEVLPTKPTVASIPSAAAEAIVRLALSLEDLGLSRLDRKSTRLNSSHGYISYAVFCLKKKKQKIYTPSLRTPNDQSHTPSPLASCT